MCSDNEQLDTTIKNLRGKKIKKGPVAQENLEELKNKIDEATYSLGEQNILGKNAFTKLGTISITPITKLIDKDLHKCVPIKKLRDMIKTSVFAELKRRRTQKE